MRRGQIGLSRSEFFARAADHWLAAIDDDHTTTAINRVNSRNSLCDALRCRSRRRGRFDEARLVPSNGEAAELQEDHP